MKTTRIVASVLACAIAGTAMAIPPAPTISEAGVGPFRVGMSWARLQHASPGLRREAVTDYTDCYTASPRSHPGVSLLIQRGRLSVVDIDAPSRLATSRGIHVGSTDAQVRAAYPGAVRQASPDGDATTYWLTAWTTPHRSGVRFIIENHRVRTIDAGGSAITLFEGCET